MRLIKFLLASLIIHVLILCPIFSSDSARQHSTGLKKPVSVYISGAKPEAAKPEAGSAGRLIFKPSVDPEEKADKKRLVSVQKKEDKKEKSKAVVPKEIVASQFKTKAEYEAYLRKSFASTRMEGIPVPDLCVAYYDVREILSVIDYYGLKLLAFPDPSSGEQPYFIEVKDYKDDKFLYHHTFDFSAYSNRVKDRSGDPYFEKIKRKIAESYNLNNNTMRLVSLTPNKSDRYFQWKQVETIRRCNLKPEQVKATFGRYWKTNFGGWVLVIDKLLLKDGQMFNVAEDFEVQEISV